MERTRRWLGFFAGNSLAGADSRIESRICPMSANCCHWPAESLCRQRAYCRNWRDGAIISAVGQERTVNVQSQSGPSSRPNGNEPIIEGAMRGWQRPNYICRESPRF